MTTWTYQITNTTQAACSVIFTVMLLADSVNYESFDYGIESSLWNSAMSSTDLQNLLSPMVQSTIAAIGPQYEQQKQIDTACEDMVSKAQAIIGMEISF